MGGWAQYYADGMGDDLPNGPPVSNPTPQGYADRVSRCMEHAYSEQCRPWKDGEISMSMADHITSPGRMRKMISHLEEDMNHGPAADDGPPMTRQMVEYAAVLKKRCEKMKADAGKSPAEVV